MPFLPAGRLSTIPTRACVVIALLVSAPATHAQSNASPEADGPSIQGPPPPVAPAVVSRDGAGQVTIRAVRVGEPMRIDGELDEAFYQATPPIGDFVQTLPDAGAPASERTEAWIAFDDSNVYVSARVWESGPERDWVANEMRRDSPSLERNDHFGVYLDTYYDRRNGIGFFVNPLGGFTDLQITNEEDVNTDWNPIAQIRTGRFDGGWTVEMAIPFRSIRYRAGRDQVWGIQMRRYSVSKSEWDHLTPLPLSVVGNGTGGATRVSLYGTVVGIEPPAPSVKLELKPYWISGVETDKTVVPEKTNDAYADAGLDVKYGITENLTADLTYNTDFAQVEVDEQQVNLTRFNLFFPEKRDFFLENQGIFEFGNGGRGPGSSGSGGPPGSSSVSSSGRGRGGRSVNAPSLFYSRQIGLQSGLPVPIFGGGRVTGKVGSFDVGAVGLRTESAPAAGADATTFTVLRVRRDVFARGSVGLLYENRSLSRVSGTGSNQAYGADANLAFGDNVQLFGYYARTRTDGLPGRDDSYRVRAGYRGDTWSGSVDEVVVGENFNPEIGYLRRTNFRETNLFGRFSPRPSSIPSIRQITFGLLANFIENERLGFLESRSRAGRVETEFENGDWLTFNATDSYERLGVDTPISGATMPAGSYSFRDMDLTYYLGPHRWLSGSVSVARGSFYSGHVTSLGLSRGRIEILPQLSLEPSVELNWIDLPALQSRSGQFNQHVARARVTYSMSPRAFLSGLVQYNTASDTFSSNVRFRWEWAPGSELFVVYNEDRDTDVLDRWSALSSRALVIKATRLLRL
jgi:Domain of unknown function (DUF5916)